jgi:hypothetical protein
MERKCREEQFHAFDAAAILKIRLTKCEGEDFISWTREKHKNFTIPSAYNLAVDLKNNSPPNTSTNQNGDRCLWKIIWNTNVPPKVRVFYLEAWY